MEEEILKDINTILTACFPQFMEGKTLTSDVVLNDVGINSIAFIKLVVEIESKYNIEFSDEDMDVSNYSKVSDIISKVVSLRK